MAPFFIHDALKFLDIVHAVKPEPRIEIPQAASAHDTFWDFVSTSPEPFHMVMRLISDSSVVWDEAQKISGMDSDFHRRELWDSIQAGEFPEWDLGVQFIPEEDEFKFGLQIPEGIPENMQHRPDASPEEY